MKVGVGGQDPTSGPNPHPWYGLETTYVQNDTYNVPRGTLREFVGAIMKAA